MKINGLKHLVGAAALCAGIAASPVRAGDQPRYEAPPAWVLAAPAIDPAKVAAGTPLVVFDVQERLEGDVVWSYVDTAIRADTPDSLTKLGTLKASWAPDKGDLVIHRAQIIRGAETIDLLDGERFTILRREEQLDNRMLDGQLTATMPVPGLRVGDILRLTLSETMSDKALAGQMQTGVPLLSAPRTAGFVRMRASWPAAIPVRWQIGAGAAVPATAKTAGGYRTLDVPLPLPKRDEMPEDAPLRYRMGTLLQLGTFASWEQVSQVMSPLFATAGSIRPGDPIDKEIAAIKAATPDPMIRAAHALELVQGRISYLLQGMNGGNYVPQTPALTWQVRYGDCKAKTLLLLAMLRAMDIEAEPVLARISGGDALPGMLPMPGDFDHVFVHARIAGEDLWLDGTDLGTKLDDLRDTPQFFNVLPLRPAGAGLLAMPQRANARPNYAVTLTMDERAGIDLPALYDIAVTMRGAPASQVNTDWLQSAPGERRDKIYKLIKDYVGDSLMSDWDIRYDAGAGTATLAAKGIMTTPWTFERGRQRQTINLLSNRFAPDRARPAWQNVPVIGSEPSTTAWHTTYLLPEGGTGVTLDGDPTLDTAVGGARIVRSAQRAGATYTLVERIDWTGGEIAPANIAAEKEHAAKIATTIALVAPADARRAWEYGSDAAVRTRMKPLDDALARAIVAWPETGAPYEARANVRAGLLDWRGAIADLDWAIRLEPSASLYLDRLGYRLNLGDKAGALQDADAALGIEPGNASALMSKASVLEAVGRPQDAVDLLKGQIGDTSRPQGERSRFITQLADILGNRGETDQALAAIADGLNGNPGDAVLLNARCWTKGTRQVQLDTALRDCTKAIELSDEPAVALDSRAMVYFRLGRMDDALADLDAALQSAPDLVPSSYMRGIVRKRMGSVAAGDAEIQSALRRQPLLADRYRKYGVTP